MRVRLLGALMSAALAAGACGGGERAVRVAGGDAIGRQDPPVEDSVLPSTTETTGVPGTAPNLEEALPGQRLPSLPDSEAYALLHDGVAGARPGGAAYLPAPARTALAEMAATTGRRIAVPAATPAIVRSDWGEGMLGSVEWKTAKPEREADGIRLKWGSETWELVWDIAIPRAKVDWHGCNIPGTDVGDNTDVTIRPGVVGCFTELSGEGTNARWLRWFEGGVFYSLESEPLVFSLDELLSVARGEMATFG
jgi:hypothetical protein